MPLWINILLTIVYVAWLFAVLIFLYLIWHNGAKRARVMDQTRIDAAMISANAALEAAEAAHILAKRYEEGRNVP